MADNGDNLQRLLNAAGEFGLAVMERLKRDRPREYQALTRALERRQLDFRVVVDQLTSGTPTVQLVIVRGEDDLQVLATQYGRALGVPPSAIN